MRAVRFIKSYAPYNAGDVAGFPKNAAAELIKQGFAAEYKTPRTKEVESPPVDKMVKQPKTKGKKAKGK